MTQLFSLLKESKADDFIIKEVHTQSKEAFFVGKKLDMSRAKDVTHTKITVYVDSEDKKYRGSASKEIHPTSSIEEMKKEIDECIFAAQFVQNPWFSLVSNQTCQNTEIEVDLDQELGKIVEAMQKVKETHNEKINSYEVFVNKKNTHVMNSQGVDVSFSNFECEVEVVVNASKDGHEIELIKEFVFANKSSEEIIQDVEKMFESGHQRLVAKPTKKNEHANVILSGDDVVEFFRYFIDHTNASNQYMGVAKAKIDEKLTNDKADELTINLQTNLTGSTKTAPYDLDGNSVKDKVLFSNGTCKSFWGSNQHAQYIELEDATSINNVIVAGGSVSEEEMRKEPYLEITDFSAFVMDSVSGNFGGEIRLGYESDGINKYPVVGGSLSANYANVLKNVKFSKEVKQINNYVVPCSVYLSDVVVAGEE